MRRRDVGHAGDPLTYSKATGSTWLNLGSSDPKLLYVQREFEAVGGGGTRRGSGWVCTVCYVSFLLCMSVSVCVSVCVCSLLLLRIKIDSVTRSPQI